MQNSQINRVTNEVLLSLVRGKDQVKIMWMEGGTARVTCPAQEHNSCTGC